MRYDKGTPTQDGSADEASGFADGTTPLTLQTRSGDGIQFTVITVPRGVSGEVSIREVTEGRDAPRIRDVKWAGQRVDLVAPSAPADNPLRLEIYVQRKQLKSRRDGRNAVLYHSENVEGPPVRLPRCERGAKVAAPDRCLSRATTIRRDGIVYLRFVALATDNGSWRPGFI